MNRRTILIICIAAALILGGYFVVRATRPKPRTLPGQPPISPDLNDLDYLKTFLVHPEKLGSPDLVGDWKGMDPELVEKLRALSEELGEKVQINSGHRSDAHNASVGGVANSSHLTKKAADIHAGSPARALEIAKAAARVGFRRIGVGNSFVHVDTDYSKNFPTAWGREYYSSSPYSKSQLMPLLFP